MFSSLFALGANNGSLYVVGFGTKVNDWAVKMLISITSDFWGDLFYRIVAVVHS